jgi:hypothetical protein
VGGYQTAIAGGDGEAKAWWTLSGACCEFRGLVVELMKLRGREGVKRTEVSKMESPSTSTFDFHKKAFDALQPCVPGVTNYNTEH